MGRKWRVPPPRGHILSLGKTGLFVQRSELFVCTEASMSVCMLRLNRVLKPFRIVQNSDRKSIHRKRISLTSQPMSLIKSALQHVAFLNKILLPTDLINGPQTETLILHQTPTKPPTSFLPKCPISSSSLIRLVLISLSSPYPQFTLSFQHHAISFSSYDPVFFIQVGEMMSAWKKKVYFFKCL